VNREQQAVAGRWRPKNLSSIFLEYFACFSEKSIIKESSIFLPKRTGFYRNRVTERIFDYSSLFRLTSSFSTLGRIFDISSKIDLLFRFSMLGKNKCYFFVF